MSDMLLQIYTRHEQADVTRKYLFLDIDDGEKAHEDREWLLTEVERQRAEIKRLRVDLATQQNCCDEAAAQDAHIRREREEHRAEAEKRRAEIERLHRAHDVACEGGERLHAKNNQLRLEIERAKADAWDEGYQDHRDMIEGIARKPSNPYR